MNLSEYKKFFLSVITVFTGLLATAQKNPVNNITIASPNAASLGKYGDIPVSFHTGIPQVNIPVYTVKEGSLELPVSLSYHASGLKIMEPSSWVGAGWSLNAGGVITRTVIGANDDRGFGVVSDVTHGHFSDYGYNSYLFNMPANGAAPPPGLPGPPDEAAFANGHKDGEPDLYFFNFGNYSGKFYFRDDRTPVIVPEEDFRIEPIVIAPNVYIQGFIITTPDGVKYSFGKNQAADGNINAFEVTSPYTSQAGLTYGSTISSWFLNKITSADDQFSIKLIYQQENYSYYTLSMSPLISNDMGIGKIEYTLVKNFLQGVRLSQINFPNGNVNFVQGSVRSDLGNYDTQVLEDIVNTEAKTLGSIQITDNAGFCKIFDFSYNYFIDNVTPLPGQLSSYIINTDKKRLRLESIQEKSCDNSLSIPPHSFTYTTPSTDNLFAPRRLTFAQDHWGFYNGKSNNTLIPTYTVNDLTSFPGANRESSWPESGYGTLNKITYPTGGSTQFVFEPNDVWSVYKYNSEQAIYTRAIGPGVGNSQAQSVTIDMKANPYRIRLKFSHYVSNSTASAYFGGLTVNKSNPLAEIIIQPGVGRKTFDLSEGDMIASEYAECSITEVIPGQYQGNKIVGGLRIKTITNTDVTAGTPVTTSYAYQRNGQSTGILYSRPIYVQVLRNDLLKQVGLEYPGYLENCSPNGCLSCDIGLIYFVSPCSVRPMAVTQGNHIGYNEVQVTQTGNGYSLYKYYGSNIWDVDQSDVSVRNVKLVCNTTVPNFPAAPLPFEFMRGELKYEGHFKETGQILKESTYYPVYVTSAVTTPAYLLNSWGLTLYNIATARKTKITKISNDYSSSGMTLQTIDSSFYESPYHHQVTRKVTVNSTGDRIEAKYKNSFDFRIPNCEAVSDCYQGYASSYATALNTFNYQLNNCVNTTKNCKHAAFIQYRYDWSLARKNYVACRKTNFTDAENAFKTNHDNAKVSADSQLKPILELQDRFISIPIEITTWKNGKLTGASYAKYDYSTNPSTKVYPSKTQIINLSAPVTNFIPSTNTNTTLLKDSRYLDEASYKYYLGNLAEVLPKSGVYNSYVWGSNNNLPIVKAIGVTQATLKSAYDAVSGNIAVLRSQPSLANAQIFTYTYSPLKGMTSETNAQGILTSYEYDALGRLSVVRDKNNNILKKISYNYTGAP